MATDLAAQAVGGLPTLTFEEASLAQSLTTWRPSEGTPNEATPTCLIKVKEAATAMLTPAGPERVGVLLYRLFLVTPPPDPKAMKIYVEKLAHYPAFALAAAVEAIMEKHKWPSPVTIADIVAHVRRQPDYQRCSRIKSNCETLQMRQRKFPRREIAATSADASIARPNVKRVESGQSKREAEAQLQRDKSRTADAMAADGWTDPAAKD